MSEYIKEQYEQLCDEIWKHNRLYFQEGKPIISDDEFDRLVVRLQEMERVHPEWVSSTSPTQRIGEKPLEGFAEIEHAYPMLSLEKAFSEDEVQAFYDRMKKLLHVSVISCCLEIKLDGLAISVIYKKGRFVQAITRGDGKVGSDVTQNLKTIRNFPLRISSEAPEELEVRGEVFLPKDAFEEMNRERASNNEPLWANPRNAAAGSLKLLDPQEVANRSHLAVVFYGAPESKHLPVKSQYKLHHYLERLGLPTAQTYLEAWFAAQKRKAPRVLSLASSVEEIMQFIREIEKERDTLAMGIDGVVAKIDDILAFERLGNTGKHPRAALAYKFSAEQTWTRLNAITVQVGRTGVLTPVAELEPVFLAGSTICRATLHNFDEIERKDIREGDWALVEKGGDVIPKVVAIDPSKRVSSSKKWHMPHICPSCGSIVTNDATEVAWRCPNSIHCEEQLLRRFIHFAGKDGFDIENLGEKVMEQLVKKGFVRKFSDIFTLTREQMAQLDGFKEKSVNNLYTSIEKSKKVSLARFLMALGIRFVGTGVADLLAKRALTIDTLKQMTKEQLLAIPGIGEKVAGQVVDYFKDQKNIKEIEQLLHCGIFIEKPKVFTHKETPFLNKTVVLTGTLQHYSRQAATEKIEELGGKVTDSISKKTGFLIVGADPGSKLDKAKKLGIPILDEAQFIHIVNEELVS